LDTGRFLWYRLEQTSEQNLLRSGLTLDFIRSKETPHSEQVRLKTGSNLTARFHGPIPSFIALVEQASPQKLKSLTSQPDRLNTLPHMLQLTDWTLRFT